jgi:hypothetical protein
MALAGRWRGPHDGAVDPVFLAVLAIGLAFFGLMGALFVVTFIVTWRRGSGPARRPAATFFDLFPRPVVLGATAVGAIACLVFAVFWIVLFAGFR